MLYFFLRETAFNPRENELQGPGWKWRGQLGGCWGPRERWRGLGFGGAAVKVGKRGWILDQFKDRMLFAGRLNVGCDRKKEVGNDYKVINFKFKNQIFSKCKILWIHLKFTLRAVPKERFDWRQGQKGGKDRRKGDIKGGEKAQEAVGKRQQGDCEREGWSGESEAAQSPSRGLSSRSEAPRPEQRAPRSTGSPWETMRQVVQSTWKETPLRTGKKVFLDKKFFSKSLVFSIKGNQGGLSYLLLCGPTTMLSVPF